MSTSGPDDLTSEESALLDKHFEFYQELRCGLRDPKTAAQRHFVEVCQGLAKAETPHELAFVKWRKWIASLDERIQENDQRHRITDFDLDGWM